LETLEGKGRCGDGQSPQRGVLQAKKREKREGDISANHKRIKKKRKGPLF
jgi:hypothetical protein